MGQGSVRLIRLGIVGYGKWGRNYLNAARESGIGDVTHAVLRPGSKNEQAALSDGLWTCSSIECLPGRVDAAIVAVHPPDSVGICQKLLAMGLPVMLEKPAALNSPDAARLSSSVLASELPFLVCHQHLFAPAYEAIRRIASIAGRLGVWARAGNTGPSRDYSPLWDYGPHDVAMVLGLDCINPSVSCTRRKNEGGWLYDLRLSSEQVTAQATICNSLPERERKFTVVADGVTMRYIDEGGPTLRIDGTSVDVPYERPLTRAVREFCRAVVCGGTDDWRFGPFWVIRVTEIIETAEASAKVSCTA